VEKQKKGLFGSRNIYHLTSTPIGTTVCRRRSDFEWLSEKLHRDIPELQQLEGKEKADVEKFLKVLGSNPKAMKHPFFIYFMTCTNSDAFHRKKKKESETKKQPEKKEEQQRKLSSGAPPSDFDQKMKGFLDELYTLAKSNRATVKDLQKHFEDLIFLLDQTNQKLRKIGSCFSKLSENWEAIEKIPAASFDSVFANLSISAGYQELKLSNYQWNNDFEKNRQQLKKVFSAGVEKILNSSKELQKNLKIRRETEGNQGKVADEITFADFINHLKVEKEEIGKWCASSRKLGEAEKNMEKIISIEREGVSPGTRIHKLK